MRCGSSNNYELIFPSLFEEEKNQQYEVFIKKANDIWDEFTTGAKGKKRAAEMAAEKEKADMHARKLQQIKRAALLKDEQLKKRSTLPVDRRKGSKNQAKQRKIQITQITQNTDKSDDEGNSKDNELGQKPVHDHSENRQSSTGPNTINHQLMPENPHQQSQQLGQSISGLRLGSYGKNGGGAATVPDQGAHWKANNTADNFNPGTGGNKSSLMPQTGSAHAGVTIQRGHTNQNLPTATNVQHKNKLKLQLQQHQEGHPKRQSNDQIHAQYDGHDAGGHVSRLIQCAGVDGAPGHTQVRKQIHVSSNNLAQRTQRGDQHLQMQTDHSGEDHTKSFERRNLHSPQRRSNNFQPQGPLSLSSNPYGTSNQFANFQSFSSQKEAHHATIQQMEELRIADQTPSNMHLVEASDNVPSEHALQQQDFLRYMDNNVDTQVQHGLLEVPPQGSKASILLRKGQYNHRQPSSPQPSGGDSHMRSRAAIGQQQAQDRNGKADTGLGQGPDPRHAQAQTQLQASRSKPPSRQKHGEEMNTIDQGFQEVPASSVAHHRLKRLVPTEKPPGPPSKNAALIQQMHDKILLDHKHDMEMVMMRSAADTAFAEAPNGRRPTIPQQPFPPAHHVQFNANLQARDGRDYGRPFVGGGTALIAVKHDAGPTYGPPAGAYGQPEALLQIPSRLKQQKHQKSGADSYPAQPKQQQASPAYQHKTPQQTSSKFPGLANGNKRVNGYGSGGIEPFLHTLVHQNKANEDRIQSSFKNRSIINQNVQKSTGKFEITPPDTGTANERFLIGGNSNQLKNVGYQYTMNQGSNKMAGRSKQQSVRHPNMAVASKLNPPLQNAKSLQQSSAYNVAAQSHNVNFRIPQIQGGGGFGGDPRQPPVRSMHNFQHPVQQPAPMQPLQGTPKQKRHNEQDISQNIFYQNPLVKSASKSMCIHDANGHFHGQVNQMNYNNDFHMFRQLQKAASNQLKEKHHVIPFTHVNTFESKGQKYENLIRHANTNNVLKNEQESTFFVPANSNFNPNRRTRK